MNPIAINELSNLASVHKLVPFLGAGASYGHLKLDWDSISAEMAKEVSVTGTSNLEIAENYVKAKGAKGLCDFLKRKLLVVEYDETLDYVPLAVASLGIGLIYTTNQDNVFEKCIEKYGRKYRVVSKIEDLASYRPGDSMYIKYHGDLENPDSIIFTETSYQTRMKDRDHFLNLKIRSDLLCKNFLFVGYSFRDPNICLIFEELNKAFEGKLPQSYLIAFSYTTDLNILSDKYGISIINPMEEFPESSNNIEAFEKYITQFCADTCSRKRDKEIDNLFRSDVPISTKIVSKYEIAGIENIVKTSSFEELINLFRANFDCCLIPEIYHDRVCTIFLEMCKKCSTRQQSDDLSAALFNLKLNIKNAIDVFAGVLTTSLHRGISTGFDLFHPLMPSLNESVYPVAVARAIELIHDWGLSINDAFRCHVTDWIEGYTNLSAEIQEYIKHNVNGVWSGKTTYENPISYWERLGNKSPFGNRKTFHTIQKELLDNWPKEFTKPYEE